MNQARIAALILAAGESTRMGEPKQLLPWGGLPLVAWQVQQMRQAGATDVVVVLGHNADNVGAAVPPEGRTVLNQGYREGRATSLRVGAGALSDDTAAVLILSVDQPRPAWLSRLLIEKWQETRAPLVSPHFPRGFGHPLLVDGSLLNELRQVEEATLGLRAVVEHHVKQSAGVAIQNQSVDVDLNRPGDYESALASFQRGEWDADLASPG